MLLSHFERRARAVENFQFSKFEWLQATRELAMRQIGPIVDKQTVRRHLDRYEEEEYPDGSGPDLYRARLGFAAAAAYFYRRIYTGGGVL
jgi:hypothetical protein